MNDDLQIQKNNHSGNEDGPGKKKRGRCWTNEGTASQIELQSETGASEGR